MNLDYRAKPKVTRNVNQYSRDTSTKPMDSVSNTSNPIIGPTTRNLKRFMQTYFKEKSNKQVLYQKFSNKRVINNMNRNVPCKYFIVRYNFCYRFKWYDKKPAAS